MGQSSSKDVYACIDGKPVYKLNWMERRVAKMYDMTPEDVAYRQTRNPAFLTTRTTEDGQKVPVYNLNRMERAAAKSLGMTPDEFVAYQSRAAMSRMGPHIGIRVGVIGPYVGDGFGHSSFGHSDMHHSHHAAVVMANTTGIGNHGTVHDSIHIGAYNPGHHGHF